MPVNELTYTDEKVKIFHANQNSRLKFSDLNTMSGSSLDDSTLQLLIKLTRDLHGITSNDPAFLGLRVLSYVSNTPPAQITSEKGAIVTTNAIYRIPSLTLLPSADAFWGFYEIELVDTYGDNQTQDVFDGLALTYVNNPTRHIFSVRIYENYSVTASFPVVTPGRIRWIEYQKSSQGVSGHIVNNGVTNAIIPALTLQDLSNRIEEVNNDLDLHKADVSNPHDVGMSQLINNTANGNILMSGTHRVKDLPVPVDSGDAVPSGYLNTQLNLKIDFSTRGQPNGVATLSSEVPGRLEQRVDWSKIDGTPSIPTVPRIEFGTSPDFDDIDSNFFYPTTGQINFSSPFTANPKIFLSVENRNSTVWATVLIAAYDVNTSGFKVRAAESGATLQSFRFHWMAIL